MKKIVYSLLGFASILVGCVSTSTQMVNDDGRTMNCDAAGFGWIGAPAALIMAQNCINKQKAAGFREAGNSSSQGSGMALNQAPIPPSIASSKDGAFKIALPAGWKQAPPPAASINVQLFAINPVIDAGLMIGAVNAADIQDWHAYGESLRVKVSSSLNLSAPSAVQKIKVNGFEAERADIAGTTKTGLKFHYLSTVVKTDKAILHVIVYSFESKFEANRKEFEQLSLGLQL